MQETCILIDPDIRSSPYEWLTQFFCHVWKRKKEHEEGKLKKYVEGESTVESATKKHLFYNSQLDL
jgi:hypothetical protein